MRETNLAAVNAQLAALGHDESSTASTTTSSGCPTGPTAAIGITERTVDINGTPTNYIGMMVIVLDADFQVTWAWDAFDHLDVNRGPVLGEVVQPGTTGPTTAVPQPPGGRLAARQRRELVARGRQPGPVGPPPGLGGQDRLPQRGGGRPRRLAAGAGRRLHPQLRGPEPVVLPPAQRPLHRRPTRWSSSTTATPGVPAIPPRTAADRCGRSTRQTMTATLVLNADLGSYAGRRGGRATALERELFLHVWESMARSRPARPPTRSK